MAKEILDSTGKPIAEGIYIARGLGIALEEGEKIRVYSHQGELCYSITNSITGNPERDVPVAKSNLEFVVKVKELYTG